MHIVKFNKQTYLIEPGIGAPPEAIALESLTGPQLLSLHNLVVENMGQGRVARFADRSAALRRTRDALLWYDEDTDLEQPEPRPTKPTKQKKLKGPVVTQITKLKTTERRARQKRFFFKPMDVIKNTQGSLVNSKSGNKLTLRQRVLEGLLKDGLSFAEVEKLVISFDLDREVKSKNVERRAYEVLRLIHYYLGYGLRQDEAGRIFAYGK